MSIAVKIYDNGDHTALVWMPDSVFAGDRFFAGPDRRSDQLNAAACSTR